jgi:hypothetical protein
MNFGPAKSGGFGYDGADFRCRPNWDTRHLKLRHRARNLRFLKTSILRFRPKPQTQAGTKPPRLAVPGARPASGPFCP